MTMSQGLLAEFDNEMASTRKILERIPEDKFDWQPHDKSMKMGRLAGHVAEMANWAVHVLTLNSLDISPRADGSFEAHTMRSREETLRQYDTWVSQARQALGSTTNDAWQVIWCLTLQGKTILSMPRIAVFRTIVMNHMIHHRGQLSVYLRLNDVAVPGMYGPSADEPQGF